MKIQAQVKHPPLKSLAAEAIDPKGSKLFSVIAAEDSYALPYFMKKIYADRKRDWKRYLNSLMLSATIIQSEQEGRNSFLKLSYLIFIHFHQERKNKKTNQRVKIEKTLDSLCLLLILKYIDCNNNINNYLLYSAVHSL